jgi:hypothetical protein
MNCRICKNGFGSYPETLLLCKHKEGFVHLGCCLDLCSWKRQPCDHAIATYDRL